VIIPDRDGNTCGRRVPAHRDIPSHNKKMLLSSGNKDS
jgi:hypothetical protein